MLTRAQSILGRVRPPHHAVGIPAHEPRAALRRLDQRSLSSALRVIAYHPHFAPMLWRLGSRILPLNIKDFPLPTVIHDRNKIHHPEPDQPGKGPIPLYIDDGSIGDDGKNRIDDREDIIGDKPEPDRRPPGTRDEPNTGERGIVIIDDGDVSDAFRIF